MIQNVANKAIVLKNDRRFSVGILAEGNCVLKGCEEAYLDYLRLRASVYAIQNDYISRELIRDDGTERDEDDSRSVHFGVLEDQSDGQKVVAALRLILKNDLFTKPLPIENYFSIAFANEPVPLNNFELSRYICKHENKAIQLHLMWPLLSAGMSYAIRHNMENSYAVLEPFLERVMKARGIPVNRLAEPEFVSKYNSTNIPVNFNNQLSAKIMEVRNPGMIEALGDSNGRFVPFGICGQKGLLYADN